jgi:hypothetical protein
MGVHHVANLIRALICPFYPLVLIPPLALFNLYFSLFLMVFFLYIVLANQRLIFRKILLCRPSQRSACHQVSSQVATHQEICSQLWAGEIPDLNLGTAGQQSGVLPWSHRVSPIETPRFPWFHETAQQGVPVSLLFLMNFYSG